MAISIRQVQPGFVGEVTGVDLSQALSAENVAAIEAGMDRYAALVFHNQPLNDEQQLVFSANFGPLLDGSNTTVRPSDLRLHPAFADVSNLDKDNKLIGRDDRRRMAGLANRLWHADASFRVVPARYSMLSARIVPPARGNTELADMRAAYDALDAATKVEVEDLVCEHSLIYSREQLGFDNYLEEERRKMTPVRHRLVRVHPVTGRKSLFLSAHIGAIVGWPRPEALAFIRDLMEHATQKQFVYSHAWKVDDLLMWDNRHTLHRARPFDDLQYPRDLRRTTTQDDGPTVVQAAA